MTNIKNYPGSKNGSGVYQNIINTFPEHDIYIEGFLGSGAILRTKKEASINIGIDLAADIINNFDTGHGYFYHSGDTLIFLDACRYLLDIIHTCSNKILFYADPPYLKNTRRSNTDIYKHEWTTAHHVKFLDMIRNVKFYVVISSYRNQLYDEKLEGWNTKAFKTQTRKGPATEYLYYNFSPDLPLHQYDYLGSNFRERAAIKGRVQRTISKINRLHDLERNFLIHELLNQKNNVRTEK